MLALALFEIHTPVTRLLWTLWNLWSAHPVHQLIIISLERSLCVARPSFSLTVVGSLRAQDAEWSRLGAESLRARLRSLSAHHATSREDLR